MGSEPNPQILTETKQQEAPIKYHLTTLKNIKPGVYYLDFYFSYFNGDVWRSDCRKVEFKVQNCLERHSVLIGWLALLATF